MSRPTKPTRLVYSSGTGRMCAKCGWPEINCHCASNLPAAEPVPAKIRVNLSIGKRGPGKVVTVIDGLPGNREFLDSLARDLKKSCGTGGRMGSDPRRGSDPSSAGGRAGYVELQGDHRERLRELLAKKGWTVKG
ncbi:MAG TPA: stress response translation initiation inhibitor YciH [Thermoanaerobaculia bacterium]|nr:stress response translation initiation inhibitor YciH [Thermoanaerobaculia bacterium]